MVKEGGHATQARHLTCRKFGVTCHMATPSCEFPYCKKLCWLKYKRGGGVNWISKTFSKLFNLLRKFKSV